MSWDVLGDFLEDSFEEMGIERSHIDSILFHSSIDYNNFAKRWEPMSIKIKSKGDST